MMQMEVKN